MSEPVKSVLHEVQEARGATFRDDDGWLWTMSFASDPGGLAGYEAIRGGVSIWDVYPLVKWDVTGPDAGAAVQRVFTNDVGTQAVGQVRYGAFLNDDGTFVDDGTVFKHADDHYWVLTNTTGFGAHWAAQTVGLDFAAENRTHEMPLISVQGPASRDLLQSLTGTDLSSVRYFHFFTEPVVLAGVPVWVSRTGFSGEVGFELFPARADAAAVWTALEEGGAVPIGLDTIELARIEAGLIIYSTDYTPGVDNPYDVSLDRMVAMSGTADFVGKAALATVAAAPPKRLKTLRLDGPELPDAGADVVRDGAVVGTLSSRVNSPTYGPIGLAMLVTEHSADGTALEVVAGAGTVPASVAPLSIKDPDKRRPRG
jgi:aminomethyltransferase